MGGVLTVLKQKGFKCVDPTITDEPSFVEGEEDIRPVGGVFELPKPRTEQIKVRDRAERQSLIRYFLDGSMRTTNAGYIVDTKHRYQPVFIAQIGVATTKLEDTKLSINIYQEKNVLFLPNTFSQEDTRTARRAVRSAASAARLPFSLELECYSLEDQEKPIESARKKILSTMHDMEVNLIKRLAESRTVRRDAQLMIDGSLQFYGNLERDREAFRNVVGVSKSFDLNKRIGSGSRSREVGTLVAGLKNHHRTVARKIPHRNLAIGAWYLRLHESRRLPSLAVTDGVVKLEIFPTDPTGSSPKLDGNRCDLISENILALRHPTTPWTDSRWASHLYPIHVTERYIKTRFRSHRVMRACL